MLLEIEGFSIISDKLYWEPVKVRLCIDYTYRILDNLVSNIKKYAVPNTPVILSSEYSASQIKICIKNNIAQPEQFANGTGIGIKNIQGMMEQMGGKCSVRIEADSFSTILIFPISVS